MNPIVLPSRRLLAALIAACALTAGLLAGCASGPQVQTRPVLSERGTDKSTDLRIGESALDSGDTALAISLFERTLKVDPHSLPAELGLADAIYQTGDLARAGVLYNQVFAAAPDDPRAQLGLARVALRERHLDGAVARYRHLLQTHPDSAAVAEGLGAALDLQGRHGDAQAVYRAALARHPEVQGLKADLGLSFILDGHAREGANVLLDVAGLPDAPAQARENLALAYGLLGNDEAAKRILTADMPDASAEDNVRFYQNLRARLTDPAPISSTETGIGTRATPTPNPAVARATAHATSSSEMARVERVPSPPSASIGAMQ